MKRQELKLKIEKLIDESNIKYWDESGCEHTESSEKDKALNIKLSDQLADDIVKLFEQG